MNVGNLKYLLNHLPDEMTVFLQGKQGESNVLSPAIEAGVGRADLSIKENLSGQDFYRYSPGGSLVFLIW